MKYEIVTSNRNPIAKVELFEQLNLSPGLVFRHDIVRKDGQLFLIETEKLDAECGGDHQMSILGSRGFAARFFSGGPKEEDWLAEEQSCGLEVKEVRPFSSF